jgi:cholesterol oxidase
MGEVFGHPGLYVTDGAAIPGSLAVNPSLTILANAERIAAGIVERHRA